MPKLSSLDQNVAGLLSYLFAPISGVIFFVLEKENRFVRFHAMQSIVFGAASFAFWMGYTLLSMVFAFIPILGWIVTTLLGLAAGLGFFAVWVILMVKASSLASTITLLEITGIARRIISQTFAVFEVFIVAGAIYLLINFLITRLIRYAEWRLTPYLRRPA